MEKVACARVTVGRQKPQISQGIPPIAYMPMASASGGTMKFRSSQAISGTRPKSRITGLFVSIESFR
jgi:hypothetical protein